MRAGEVDCVVVGADRIAANGDVANKVGTYALAVLARHHGVPFYVAAPTSTIDPSASPDGDGDRRRGARPRRGDDLRRCTHRARRRRRPQPGLRRHARRARHRHRHRAGRPPPALLVFLKEWPDTGDLHEENEPRGWCLTPARTVGGMVGSRGVRSVVDARVPGVVRWLRHERGGGVRTVHVVPRGRASARRRPVRRRLGGAVRVRRCRGELVARIKYRNARGAAGVRRRARRRGAPSVRRARRRHVGADDVRPVAAARASTTRACSPNMSPVTLGTPARPLLVRATCPLAQTGRPGGERRTGVELRAPQPGRRRVVLLVDDVATTGATLRAAATTLRGAGGRSVVVATLARTPPRGAAPGRWAFRTFCIYSQRLDDGRRRSVDRADNHDRVRVLIVDDHAVFRHGLQARARGDRRPRRRRRLRRRRRRRSTRARDLAPDVVLMDVRMPDMSGIDAARTIVELHPAVRVVMLTGVASRVGPVLLDPGRSERLSPEGVVDRRGRRSGARGRERPGVRVARDDAEAARRVQRRSPGGPTTTAPARAGSPGASWRSSAWCRRGCRTSRSPPRSSSRTTR